MAEITGTVRSTAAITGTVNTGTAAEIYTGPYEVTPAWSERMLSTGGKKLTDDISVHTIPYIEVTNPAGGITATIG